MHHSLRVNPIRKLERWQSQHSWTRKMAGNKHDNGVLEQGTDEIRISYQEDTPGQSVDEYIKEKEKSFHETKETIKKRFKDVFGNPLKDYPYNEEFKVEDL